MQQLYAEIKKNSKYASQADGPFPVAIEKNKYEPEFIVKGGPGGEYRLKDCILFVQSNGELIKIKD